MATLYTSPDHPAVQAAYAHYALTAIHPFADGNGRLARTVASVFLMRSAGVPLFLVELARGARDSVEEDVPWHLRLAVGQELAALPRPVLTLLRRMALIATTVAVERLIADDLSSDQLLEYLDVALRFGILVETRRGFRFRYPLVREVLSNGLGPVRRRLWRSAPGVVTVGDSPDEPSDP